VPAPLLELCTTQMLVMDYVPGTNMLSALQSQAEVYNIYIFFFNNITIFSFRYVPGAKMLD
jgi:predicted unusual protein kinase regulating ubiquinone biosynthesis (AarF/ABC1/UbiB family)